MSIPVIDIFAGPGGLGEGFTSLFGNDKERKFKIALSIEKDPFAHQTLELRSFFRQFPKGKAPKEYYEFLRGNITRDTLFEKYPEQSNAAKEDAWLAELGDGEDATPTDVIDKRISKALNNAKNWLLIGGPPCQAYSLVGRARRGGLSDNDPRVYLYRAYYRILAVHNPPVFIMENVKGLLSSKLENKDPIFQQIINDLKDPSEAYKKLHGKQEVIDCPGYNIYSLVQRPHFNEKGEPWNPPSEYVIKCEDYGIPQARHRVILLGIRKDLKVNHVPTLEKFKRLITVKETIGGLPNLRSGFSKRKDNSQEWYDLVDKSIQNGLHDVIIQSDLFDKSAAEPDPIYIKKAKYDRGSNFIECETSIDYKEEKKWFLDKKLKGACNHETRGHIEDDIRRYVYVSIFGERSGRSPKLSEFPKELLPQHKNVNKGVSDSHFADRFRVQIADKPATTITSHISKDGHYYIHYDPQQARSLTVREAARIQTFPDNYFFCGPRTSQYTQVGNAVPPLLARKIAEIVDELILKT